MRLSRLTSKVKGGFGNRKITVFGHRTFSDGVTLSTGIFTVRGTEIIRMSPKTELFPISAGISFGVTDDPADESVQYFLGWWDDSGDPFKGIWRANQNWRIGDATGWIQTMDFDTVEFVPEDGWSTLPDKPDQTVFTLGAGLRMAFLATAASSAAMRGYIKWKAIVHWKVVKDDFSEFQDETFEDTVMYAVMTGGNT